MTTTTTKERLSFLRSEINRHNDLYYKHATPEIPDHQFDAMFAKLVELETEYPEYADPNSPTAHVGSDITNRFPKVNHPTPMLSIKSLFTIDEAKAEIQNFFANVPNVPNVPTVPKFFITPKYDGIAIELHYYNSELKLALTRGNGVQGTDVTQNIRTIQSIPKQIPTGHNSPPSSSKEGCPKGGVVIVRGEIYLTYTEFTRLNKLRKKAGLEQYNNIRSAAVSLVKAKQSSETAVARLSASFFFYSVPNVPNVPNIPSQFSTLTSLGFHTPELKTATTITEAIECAHQIAATKFDYPTDGAVIKSANVCHTANTRYQTGAWAIKTNSPVWETTLRFVSWNVSKKGKLTPIAHFVPFTENGSDFARANLYNIENINRLNLTEGDTIHVQLSGFIIPEVCHAERSRSAASASASASSLPLPSHCPACHQPLGYSRDASRLSCTNTTWCPAFGHTAQTVVKNTGNKYQVHFEIPASPLDGPGIYTAACMGENAIIARLKENKHRYVLLADNLQTVANIGIQVGEWLPGEHEFERQTTDELLAECKLLTEQSNKLLMF